MDMILICRRDFFSPCSEEQGKGIDSHGSSLPLFSIPSVPECGNDVVFS